MQLSREEKLGALEKVLASRTMQGSESLRALLRFIVTKTLDDQDLSLKEYTIAMEVFGRKGNFDPRSDSVVRVQAGRLRAKLQEYYATEGKADQVQIELPKGHYAPAFSLAPAAIGPNGSLVTLPAANADALAEPARPVEAPASPAEVEAARAGVAGRKWKWVTAGLSTLCVALGLLALYFWAAYRQAEAVAATRQADVSRVAAASPFWSDFLRSPEPVLVTFSNVLFEGTAETGMRLHKPLDTPVTSAGSPAINQQDGRAAVLTEHYTGIGEAMGVFSLTDFFNKAGRSFRVKRSLLLTWDDLKAGNTIFLGSPAENYLLRNLPQRQDFIFQVVKNENQQPVFGVVNTRPRGDEQRVYMARQEGPSRSQISEDYAVISLLKGLESDRRLLILAGITTFGTQAAAEYVAKPEYVQELVARLNTSGKADSPSLPQFYQVLIKVKVNGGVPVQSAYVTHHVIE